MRKLVVLPLAALLVSACDPRLRSFTAVPNEVCPGETVHLAWDAPRGTPVRVASDVPTVPPLEPTGGPLFRDHTGSEDVRVDRTTTFTASIPGAQHIDRRVTIRSAFGSQSFTSRGECGAVGAPPVYPSVVYTGIPATLGVTSIGNASEIPIEVTHHGVTVSLGVGLTIANPFPGQPAVGQYDIRAQNVVACSSPEGLPTEVRPAIITVTTGCL